MSRPAPVLLDALTVLTPHMNNLVLIGAQAVYHHTGEGSLNVAIMTTDADIALETNDLAPNPEIGKALLDAGFYLGQNPGRWIGRYDVGIDLMVAPHQSGRGSAKVGAARIPYHHQRTARIARGLEPSLVDFTLDQIYSFEQQDRRQFELRIAGPSALLVAKAIKLSERFEESTTRPDRLSEKDALDAFRLLQKIDTDVLVQGFELHQSEPHAMRVSTDAIRIYTEHATSANGLSPTLAAHAAGDDPTVAPAFSSLVQDLINNL